MKEIKFNRIDGKLVKLRLSNKKYRDLLDHFDPDQIDESWGGANCPVCQSMDCEDCPLEVDEGHCVDTVPFLGAVLDAADHLRAEWCDDCAVLLRSFQQAIREHTRDITRKKREEA